MNNKSYMVEICCGSYADALQAAKGGAARIELNSALALGGLTPSVATLSLVKEHVPSLPVIAMVRPRGAGFFYSEEEFLVMQEECKALLSHGADGIAFGFLNADATIDTERTKVFLHLIKDAGKEAVFHRAYDCCRDPLSSIEQLISLGVDRLLTSGQKNTAMEGLDLIAKLQTSYGSEIELLAGSGITAGNACELLKRTGIRQVHSSCKTYLPDPTTIGNGVSYQIYNGENTMNYDTVSSELVRQLVGEVASFVH